MVLREQLSPEKIAIAESNARRYNPRGGLEIEVAKSVYDSPIEKQVVQSVVSKKPMEILV